MRAPNTAAKRAASNEKNHTAGVPSCPTTYVRRFVSGKCGIPGKSYISKGTNPTHAAPSKVSTSSPAGMKRRIKSGAYGQCKKVSRRQVCRITPVRRIHHPLARLRAIHPQLPLQSAPCLVSKSYAGLAAASFCLAPPACRQIIRTGRARDDPTKWLRPPSLEIHTPEQCRLRPDASQSRPIPTESGSCEYAADTNVRRLPPACSSYWSCAYAWRFRHLTPPMLPCRRQWSHSRRRRVHARDPNRRTSNCSWFPSSPPESTPARPSLARLESRR